MPPWYWTQIAMRRSPEFGPVPPSSDDRFGNVCVSDAGDVVLDSRSPLPVVGMVGNAMSAPYPLRLRRRLILSTTGVGATPKAMVGIIEQCLLETPPSTSLFRGIGGSGSGGLWCHPRSRRSPQVVALAAPTLRLRTQ